MLEALFKYCHRNRYKISTAYKDVYEIHFKKSVLRNALTGYYIKVMNDAESLIANINGLYEDYKGLFGEDPNEGVIYLKASVALTKEEENIFEMFDFYSDTDSGATVGGKGCSKTRRKKRPIHMKKNTRNYHNNTRNNHKKKTRKKRKIRNKRITRRL
jgi:hypothetical protein